MILVFLLIPFLSFAQCEIFRIYSVKTNDSIYITWNNANADFYYVSVKPQSAPNFTVYFTGSTNLTAYMPERYYSIKVEPNCNREGCCEPRKIP